MCAVNESGTSGRPLAKAGDMKADLGAAGFNPAGGAAVPGMEYGA
jgi:hypothetical protein